MSTLIALSRPHKPGVLSKLAMWVDKGEASHALMIYFDWDWDAWMVIQVDEFGFRLIPLDNYKLKNHIVSCFSTTAVANFDLAVAKIARENAGSMYDFIGFIGMLPVLFWRAFKRKVRNPLASKSTLICTEAVVLAMQAAQWPKADSLVADSTSPQELLNFLRVN